MTIPEYDKECDCDLCTTLRNERKHKPMYSFIEYSSAGICKYCGKMMVKHIIKEGAYYHVYSWDSKGRHCSTKDCEENHGLGKCDKEGV